MTAATKATSKPSVKLSVGQAVRLADHEPVVGPDAKPVPFYDYYRNLMGTVAKVFDDGTVSVTIDRSSLPEEIRTRHEACEQRDRDKWLDRLSDDERNRLTAAQKAFSYRYTLLVGASDLIASASAAPAAKASAPAKKDAKPQTSEADTAPRRSLQEIEAEEERHLQEILKRSKNA